MSAPSTIHTDVYFVQRNDTTCARETKPSFAAANLLGEVESCTFRNDTSTEKFQKWNTVSGRREDHTVFPVQEVMTGTVVVRELSATFWQLLRRANYAFATGSKTYGYARTETSTIKFPGEGWMQVLHKDQRALVLDTFAFYGYLEVTEHNFAQGVQSVTFAFTKLYSALADSGLQGAWTNIL